MPSSNLHFNQSNSAIPKIFIITGRFIFANVWKKAAKKKTFNDNFIWKAFRLSGNFWKMVHLPRSFIQRKNISFIKRQICHLTGTEEDLKTERKKKTWKQKERKTQIKTDRGKKETSCYYKVNMLVHVKRNM